MSNTESFFAAIENWKSYDCSDSHERSQKRLNGKFMLFGFEVEVSFSSFACLAFCFCVFSTFRFDKGC